MGVQGSEFRVQGSGVLAFSRQRVAVGRLKIMSLIRPHMGWGTAILNFSAQGTNMGMMLG